MAFDVAGLTRDLSRVLVASLASDSAKVGALAVAEGEQLALALTRIAGMLGRGEIDAEEAAILARIQRHASEAVLASLAEVSRVAASKAVGSALRVALEKALGGAALAGLLRDVAA